MASSRHEVGTQSYPVALYIVVPVVALVLQSLVSVHFPRFDVVDLPLLVTIYYGISRREPVSATLIGGAIGIAQDALTQHPLGIFGIAKSVVGYVAASLGVRIDTENQGSRLLLTFGFTLGQSWILWALTRHLLGQSMAWHGVHELIRAITNALVGVVFYSFLDRFRRREY
jgi:rod shape-determining protein MreD